MVNYRVFISFILLLGFLIVPSANFACVIKSFNIEKSCCKKSSPVKKCCSANKDKSKENGCSGKCGNSNCSTTSVQNGMTFSNIIEYNSFKLDSFEEKASFFYINENISSGYVDLFLIPKIG